MKFSISVTLILLVSISVAPIRLFGQGSQGSQGAPGSAQPAGAKPAEVRQLLEGTYIQRFTRNIEPTDEQWDRLLPIIHTYIQNRFQNAERKDKALAALENAPESDISRINQEVDQATQQGSRIDAAFVSNVDPILTPNQQRRLRVFDNNIWPQLQQIITKAREIAQQQEQQRQDQQRLKQERQALRGERQAQTQPNKNQNPLKRGVK